LAGDLDDATRRAWASDGITVEPAAVAAPVSGDDPQVSDTLESTGANVSTPLAATGSHYVRVDLARLDDLMRMIGDLVISRARLAETLARIERRVPAVEWRSVHEDSAAIERQVRDLRE